MTRWQAHRRQWAFEASRPSSIIERNSIAIGSRTRPASVELSSKQSASQASDSKTGGLFGGKYHQLYGSSWFVSGARESPNRFQSAEYAHGSVEAAGVGDRIDV
jgi:hypothetical protein